MQPLRSESMGFFDMWKVSGITTDAAKTSQPFHGLAEYVKTGESNIPIEAIVKCAHIFLKMRQSFDLYFNKKMQSEKTEAVKFLVAFSSYAYGKDGYQWNWQQVRQQSQGLYGSMEESPQDFKFYNTPLIDITCNEIKEFLSNQ